MGGGGPEGEAAGMLEIRIHGRGGQGAQVGCQILAHAFFRAGRCVQAFAAYGGERRGAPASRGPRRDGGVVVVNGREPPPVTLPAGARLVTIDAAAIARTHGLGPIVATAVLGAFAGATGLVALAELVGAVEGGDRKS